MRIIEGQEGYPVVVIRNALRPRHNEPPMMVLDGAEVRYSPNDHRSNLTLVAHMRGERRGFGHGRAIEAYVRTIHSSLRHDLFMGAYEGSPWLQQTFTATLIEADFYPASATEQDRWDGAEPEACTEDECQSSIGWREYPPEANVAVRPVEVVVHYVPASERAELLASFTTSEASS